MNFGAVRVVYVLQIAAYWPSVRLSLYDETKISDTPSNVHCATASHLAYGGRRRDDRLTDLRHKSIEGAAERGLESPRGRREVG